MRSTLPLVSVEIKNDVVDCLTFKVSLMKLRDFILPSRKI